MNESQRGVVPRILILGSDSERACRVGALVEESGASWEHEPGQPCRDRQLRNSSYDAVIVLDDLLARTGASLDLHLREAYSERAVLVGLVGAGQRDSSPLIGTDVDLILYEPLVLADVERMLAFASAVHSESPRQARDRLRKMTALHELAVAAGHRSGPSGWIDRLIDAGRRILGTDALAMWVVDYERNCIKCVGSSGLDDRYIADAEARSPELISDYELLMERLSTHWLTADDTTGSFRMVAAEAARSTGIDRIAWLPIRDSNRTYGHLSFYFRGLEAHHSHDLVLADAFASIVAAALGTFWLQSEIRRTNRLYREHVESSPDGVVVCHPDGTVERSNAAMEKIAGRDRYDVIGSSIFDWFQSPDDLPWSQWTQLDSEDPADTVDLWLSRGSGERRRVSCYARRVRFPDPRTLDETEDRVQFVVRDITDQARRLVELELFHDLTRLISNHGSLEDAYELVVSRLFNYLNYRLVTIGQIRNRRRLVRRAYRSQHQDLVVPSEVDISRSLCGLAIRENRSLLIRDVSMHPAYVSIDDDVVSEIVALIRADGKPIGVINIQTDETQPMDRSDLQLAESIAAHLGLLIEQVTVHERLERQALTDPLTGIANRRAFIHHLQALVSDPEKPTAALLLVELDNFKGVNDRFGHLFGDEMLKQVTRRLRTVLRDPDILARYGGDEIAMIFHDLTPETAFEVAERLRETIYSRPFAFQGQVTHLTVSIGVALFPFHGTSTDELIAEADRAMYAAKLEGRNSVQGDFPRVI